MSSAQCCARWVWCLSREHDVPYDCIMTLFQQPFYRSKTSSRKGKVQLRSWTCWRTMMQSVLQFCKQIQEWMQTLTIRLILHLRIAIDAIKAPASGNFMPPPNPPANVSYITSSSLLAECSNMMLQADYWAGSKVLTMAMFCVEPPHIYYLAIWPMGQKQDFHFWSAYNLVHCLTNGFLIFVWEVS